MRMDHVWTDATRKQLRELAAKGLACSEIGTAMGITTRGIVRRCIKEGIEVVRYTPDELIARKALERSWDVNAINKRREQRKQALKRPGVVAYSPLGSPTSAAYRRQVIGRAPDMTLSQRRNMLAEAVRNTAAMQVE